jgi:uncharacterized protein (TIGR03435 family)
VPKGKWLLQQIYQARSSAGTNSIPQLAAGCRHSDMQLITLLAGFCFGALAQIPTKFDVVSIKPVVDYRDEQLRVFASPGGVFTAYGVVVKLLIMQGHSVSEFEIVGAPDWTETDRFEIKAKAEGVEKQLTPAEANPMIRALLEDRFGLKFHRETRRLPIFALVPAKGGAKLKPAADLAAGRSGGMVGSVGYGSFTGTNVPLMRLTQMLAAALGKPVVDQTGLSGNFDFKVEFVKNSVPDPGLPGVRRTLPEPPSDAEGPSLFTALQEQLGLRLEAQTGPVEVVVIDTVQRPSEN